MVLRVVQRSLRPLTLILVRYWCHALSTAAPHREQWSKSAGVAATAAAQQPPLRLGVSSSRRTNTSEPSTVIALASISRAASIPKAAAPTARWSRPLNRRASSRSDHRNRATRGVGIGTNKSPSETRWRLLLARGIVGHEAAGDGETEAAREGRQQSCSAARPLMQCALLPTHRPRCPSSLAPCVQIRARGK